MMFDGDLGPVSDAGPISDPTPPTRRLSSAIPTRLVSVDQPGLLGLDETDVKLLAMLDGRRPVGAIAVSARLEDDDAAARVARFVMLGLATYGA